MKNYVHLIGGRLNRCVVFWAVKKDADKIKREDFTNPKREDEYGTSVMGIQFNKQGTCTVSIKNRYNHTVNNPDATYGNDLDKITPGLTQSFAKLLQQRGLELNNSNIEKFNLPAYTVASDGKLYKYKKEINGIYYCPGNVIIDHGNVVKLEPEKQELIDYFILDKENKTIKLYDKTIKDCFVDEFEDIEKIEEIIDTENQAKKILIKEKDEEKPVVIEVDKNNSINCVLDYLSDDDLQKIPQSIRDNIKNKKDTKYIWNYDINKELKDQNLNRKTIAMLSYLNMEYLLNSEQKKLMEKIHEVNEQKLNEEKKIKYNPNELFENEKTATIENKQVMLVPVKNETWYKKIILFIKNIFNEQ